MVYFFVDKDGTEGCANEIPNRNFSEWLGWEDVYGESCTITTLPNGTIEKVIGKKLTWEDEPYYYSGVKEIDDANNIQEVVFIIYINLLPMGILRSDARDTFLYLIEPAEVNNDFTIPFCANTLHR